MIGILTDSHGRIGSIREVLTILKNMGCQTIFHLGDVCDSRQPETTNTCMQILLDDNVKIIKGNQEKKLIRNHLGWENSPVSQRILQTIQSLDQTIYQHNAIFTHSLPIIQGSESALMTNFRGKREVRRILKILRLKSFEWALKRFIDQIRIIHFCNRFPGKILFRGHHHSAKITWPIYQQINEIMITPENKLKISGKIPCVVSCCPLTKKQFIVWDMDKNEIECFSFS